MKKAVYIILILFLFSAVKLNSESLYKEGYNLYSGAKEYEIGDTIKIIINEERIVKYRTESSSHKKANISGGEALQGLIDFLPQITGGDSISGSSEGKTKTETELEAVITAVVTNIQNDGKLEISGRHSFVFNNQADIIQISGIVDPSSIYSGNKVYSSDIIDVSIAYKNEMVNSISLSSNELIELQTVTTNTNYMDIHCPIFRNVHIAFPTC